LIVGKLNLETVRASTPNDFWLNSNQTSTSSYYGVANLGFLGTQGSFNVDLVCNGWRDENNEWQSNRINGEVGASQISLQPDGDIVFYSQAIKDMEETYTLESSMIIDPGIVYLTNTSLYVSDSFSKPIDLPGVNNSVYGFRANTTGTVYASRINGPAYFANRSSTGDLFSLRRQGTQIGTISITSAAVSYNTGSDYRLKENVVRLDDSISRLKELNPSRFNFKVEPNIVVDGFIAHEVQDVVPEAVTGIKDAVDDEGNPDYQGIDQSKLVPLLTAALQESISRIEALEAEVQSLKLNS